MEGSVELAVAVAVEAVAPVLSSGVPPVCWTLGLCGRVMVVVVLPFVRWLLSDRGMEPTWVVPGFDPPADR